MNAFRLFAYLGFCTASVWCVTNTPIGEFVLRQVCFFSLLVVPKIHPSLQSLPTHSLYPIRSSPLLSSRSPKWPKTQTTLQPLSRLASSKSPQPPLAHQRLKVISGAELKWLKLNLMPRLVGKSLTLRNILRSFPKEKRSYYSLYYHKVSILIQTLRKLIKAEWIMFKFLFYLFLFFLILFHLIFRPFWLFWSLFKFVLVISLWYITTSPSKLYIETLL